MESEMTVQDYSSDTRRGAADQPDSATTIGDAARRVGNEASKVAEHAQEKATAFLAGQKAAAADHLEGLSQPLHEAVDRLRQKSPGLVGDYAQRAVDGLDSVAAALREQDMRAMALAVENFARRRPTMFIAGSVAAGFALARFLKSSSRGPQAGGNEAGGAAEYRATRETPLEKDRQ
jgi:hypothetical protein